MAEGTITLDAPGTLEAAPPEPLYAEDTDAGLFPEETGGADAQVETDAPATDVDDPDAELSPEELAAELKKARKAAADADYRREQAVKDVRENARKEAAQTQQQAAFEAQLAAASDENRTQFVRQVAGLQAAYQRAFDEGKLESPTVPQVELAKIATAIDAQSFTRAISGITNYAGEYIGQKFGDVLTDATKQKVWTATAEAARNGRPDVMGPAIFDAFIEAATANAEKVLRPKIEAEVKAQFAEEAKAAGIQRQSAERAAGGRPTAVGGIQRAGKRDHDAVLNNPKSTMAERQAAFLAKHGVELTI